MDAYNQKLPKWKNSPVNKVIDISEVIIHRNFGDNWVWQGGGLNFAIA